MYGVEDLLQNIPDRDMPAVISVLTTRDSVGFTGVNGVVTDYLEALTEDDYSQTVIALPLPEEAKYESGFHLFQHKIPMWLFIFTCLVMAFLAFKHNLSLIPILGLVSCLYMMAQIPAKSWLGFFIWLAAGLVIYFGYGYSNSKLAKR
jgi:hypothetical protein